MAVTARERTEVLTMAKTSGMQAYAERYAEVKAQAAQMLVCQYMQDTLQLALHQTEGWGYDRIVRLCKAWQHIRDEYRPAINPSNPEADVMQEHMDRVLAQIISGKQELIPFAERYPELKKVRYGR